jgi:hypothetical protein
MSKKFTVSETDVRKRDGDVYSIDNYREGDDYVLRKCFSSFKRVFRSDILGVSTVDPSLVEYKQEPRAMLELDEKGLRIVFEEPVSTRQVLEEAGHTVRPVTVFEPSVEDWRPAVPECKEIEQSQVSGTSRDQIQECKVKRIYPNFRWVETDKGKIFAGLKGASLKVGQIIKVLNGELCLKKTGPNKSMVRI